MEKPDADLKSMRLKFEHTQEPYKDVLAVCDLEITVGDEQKVLCKGVNFAIKKKEKIAIIGANGIGKSSFLKIIQGIIPYTNGTVEWGKNISISYYEQENLNLNQDKIALDELWDRFPNVPEAEIRRVLGNVLLTKDDVYKPVKVISGGERAKLAFCIIPYSRLYVRQNPPLLGQLFLLLLQNHGAAVQRRQRFQARIPNHIFSEAIDVF